MLRLKQDLRACRMLRFGFVLLITAPPLLGVVSLGVSVDLAALILHI